MMTPKIEPLPPETIEFLRVVRGVETIRFQCNGYMAVQVASWADLGLPEDSPFPPLGKAWKCSRCGRTEITATPHWPTDAKHEIEAPAETVRPPDTQDTITEAPGAISPELRGRLQDMLARLDEGGK